MQTSLSSGSLNPRASEFPGSEHERPAHSQPFTALEEASSVRSLRHRASVRVTHWIFATGVLGLIASGGGILISHPRFYWGETGSVFTPSLIDLPLPMIIGPSVWNRPIHFFFAWFLVLGALVYVIAGLATRHLRKDLFILLHESVMQ